METISGKYKGIIKYLGSLGGFRVQFREPRAVDMTGLAAVAGGCSAGSAPLSHGQDQPLYPLGLGLPLSYQQLIFWCLCSH